MLRFRPVRCSLCFSPGSELRGIYGFDASSCFSWVLFFLLCFKYAYYYNEQATKMSQELSSVLPAFLPSPPSGAAGTRSPSGAGQGATLRVSSGMRWFCLPCRTSGRMCLSSVGCSGVGSGRKGRSVAPVPPSESAALIQRRVSRCLRAPALPRGAGIFGRVKPFYVQMTAIVLLSRK